MSEPGADVAEALFDLLEHLHDGVWHVHASECCWPFGGAIPALAEFVAKQRAAALREAAEDVLLDGSAGDYGTAVWLRDRAAAEATTPHEREAGAAGGGR